MGIKPLKKFGQNYLVDKNIVNNLIQPLDLNNSDQLLEIGPGKGFITEEISKLVENLVAIEIDTRVIEDLKIKFANLTLFQEVRFEKYFNRKQN